MKALKFNGKIITDLFRVEDLATSDITGKYKIHYIHHATGKAAYIILEPVSDVLLRTVEMLNNAPDSDVEHYSSEFAIEQLSKCRIDLKRCYQDTLNVIAKIALFENEGFRIYPSVEAYNHFVLNVLFGEEQ